MDLDIDRKPARDEQRERQVLSYLLQGKHNPAWIFDRLGVSDFYLKKNRILFEHCFRAYQQNRNFCLIDVYQSLKMADLTVEIPWGFLGQLEPECFTPSNILESVGILIDASQLREVNRLVIEIGNRSYDPCEKATTLLNEMKDRCTDILARQSFDSFEHIAKVQDRENGIMLKAAELKEVPGLGTGFRKLNEFVMFSPGDLVILAGRPSMGKSGFAKAIARNIAISGVAVGIFSLEDSSGAFYRRLLADEAEIRASKLRDPRLLNSEDWSKVVERQEKIKDLPIWIDDRPKASLRSIIAKAESVKAEHDIKLFIIDYLGLVKSDKRKENRNAEVTHICGELKDLAKFLEIPVLVLSQLNRECESRTNKRPMLSDLRESGSIEQDADTVLFIYRDSFYHQDADKTEVEIIVAKQRNGPIGRVLLKYYEEYQQFRDKEDIPIF